MSVVKDKIVTAEKQLSVENKFKISFFRYVFFRSLNDNEKKFTYFVSTGFGINIYPSNTMNNLLTQ